MFKFKCPKEMLLKPLAIASSIANQKDLYPICQNVRITSIENRLVFRSSDLKIALTYTMPNEGVTIEGEGDLLLPAGLLYNLVKETPEDEIIIEDESSKEKKAKQKNAVLIAKDGRFLLLGEDARKFPDIPEFKEDAAIQLAGSDLLKLIKKTVFATTQERTRYDLSSVLMDFQAKPGALRLAATDGKRLAFCERAYQMNGQVSLKNVTVPSTGFQQIERMLSTLGPEKVQLCFQQSHLIFRTENLLVSTRLTDSIFPPYEKVIPQEFPHHGKIAVRELTTALRRVVVLAEEKNKIVTLSFSPNLLRLSASSDMSGEATIDMPIAYEGEPVEICFNPNYLSEALKIAESAQINIELQNKDSALVIKDGEDFHYIVLPIRIREEERHAQDEGEADDQEEEEGTGEGAPDTDEEDEDEEEEEQ